MTDNDRPSALLSRRAAAERMGVSTETIKRWARAGLLPTYRLGGPTGHIRIKLADLDAMVQPVPAAGDR